MEALESPLLVLLPLVLLPFLSFLLELSLYV